MNSKLRGSVLLIAGCSIGAGMLGIPVMTGAAGFIPTSILFVLTWAFMALSGLVLAELVLSYKQSGINLLSLARESLGKVGMTVASLTFMFLFYAIMTAYMIASSELLYEFFGVPVALGSCIFVLLMYLIIARGLRLVDSLNQVLMIVLAACYVLLIGFGISNVDPSRLLRSNFAASFVSLPILVVSFGYHNLVPSLVVYLERSRKCLMKAIVIGSSIPLFIYLLWEFVILGIVPMESLAEWKMAQNSGDMITEVLSKHAETGSVVLIAQGFAFAAIVTSFLPVSFSFLDFLKDGFLKGKNERLIALCVLLPPFVVSFLGPHLFLEALDFAGGICAVILFGILPSIMAYKQQRKIGSEHFVVAKTPVLVFLLVGSFGILSIELLHLAGVL